MKIRSVEELLDRISSSSKFRKRELISIAQLISSKREHESAIGRRSALALSYAHWEGFVKDSSLAYVSYVSFVSPPMGKLSQNFQALACKATLCSAARATKRIAPHIVVVSGLIDDLERSVRIDLSTAIDTESNLDADVFENICLTVGIDYNAFWKTSAPFVQDMFSARCAIAHGEQFTPDHKFASETIEFVLKAINDFGDQIVSLAYSKKYLRNDG